MSSHASLYTSPQSIAIAVSGPPQTSALAINLPFHILVSIFCEARESASLPEYDFGPSSRGWDSNESIHAMCLVHPSWRDAARFYLYRSVSIVGHRQACLFLRTLGERPAFRNFVRSLVIGDCEDMAGEEEVAVPRMVVSENLLDILQMCPRVEDLHLHTLHASVRSRLMAAIVSKELQSLSIVVPASLDPPLLEPDDIVRLATPTMKYLELGCSVSAPSSPRLPRRSLSHTSCVLVNLRASCTGDSGPLFELTRKAAPTLTSLHVYFEDIVHPSLAARALEPGSQTLRNVSYTCNLTADELVRLDVSLTPVFDRLLPRFCVLERLSVSATDISTNLFCLIPPSLRHLEIYALNIQSTFFYSTVLLDALTDGSVRISLETLIVHDESWSRVQADALQELGRARGIDVRFTMI